MCLDKPLQVCGGWPTLVNGELELLVPDGGKCFVCKTDLSGKVAKYAFKNIEYQLGNEAFVMVGVKDNISCGNPICRGLTWRHVEAIQPTLLWGEEVMVEYRRSVKYSKFCEQCLKSSLNTHRCNSCRSAQYCSEECRVKDLDWHKTVCEKWAKDDRKKMPGRKEQKTEIKKWMKPIKLINLDHRHEMREIELD
jgi:hypothetical protein